MGGEHGGVWSTARARFWPSTNAIIDIGIATPIIACSVGGPAADESPQRVCQSGECRVLGGGPFARGTRNSGHILAQIADDRK